MKRLLPALSLALLFLLPPPLRTAGAEGTADAPRYAVAASENVWFYAAENEASGLFLMPYTYYVRVLREGSYFCAVQYLDDVAPYRAVTGFCRTEDLTFVDFVPARPYLRREITVTYVLDGNSKMGNGAFDKVERSFVYYGTCYSGTAKYFYVYADGVFDYVPAMQDITFDLNTDYLEAAGPAEAPPGETDPPGEEKASPFTVVLVCGVGVAVLVAAALLLRRKKPAPPAEEGLEF